MAGEASFIWDLLSDVWDDYQDKDQIASLWEGYLQITSDLFLQLLQADASKSIIDIPTFRRYRWKHYPLNVTSAPPSYTSPFLLAYNAGDVDVVSIPKLLDMVRAPADDEYLQITTSNTGFTVNGTELHDVVHPFSTDIRVGDYVRFLSGTSLAEADTDVRLQIAAITSPTVLALSAIEITDASNISYVIERSPVSELTGGSFFTTSAGKIAFTPSPWYTPDGTGVAFQAVKTLEYSGDLVRDDPRPIIDNGNAVTSGAGNIVRDGEKLTDTSALFITGPTPVVAGDYLVLRPSGVLPSQILTTQVIYKIAYVASDTVLVFAGKAPTTTEQVQYVVLRPSVEDFDVVSTEDGIDGFSLGFAIRTVGAAAPSGSDGSLAGDTLTSLGANFSSLVTGKKLRVLSGTGLLASELAEFSIVAVLGATQVQLDRAVTSPSTLSDAVYLLGEILAVDVVAPRSDPSLRVYPEAFRYYDSSSNTASVTDGSIFFNHILVPFAGAYIYYGELQAANAGISASYVPTLWAEETISDQQALFANFGFPIQLQQPNSDEYKNVLQGLWYAYWNGPSLDNIIRGLNLMFSLPYAPKDGVISNVTLPDPAVLTGTVTSLMPGGTFDTSSTNPFGDSRFFSFEIDNMPPVLVILTDTPTNPNVNVIADINAVINPVVGYDVASLSPSGQVTLTASKAVKIDTAIGNPGLGFNAGDEDFGIFNVTILYDDNTDELLEFGTQFPLAVDIGTRVEKFQQLTTAVGIFDYVSLPQWWTIFEVAMINPDLTAYSDADRAILNDIMKDFTFAVRVVADAFTRLGPVDRDVIRFFLEQIKPTISDFLFIVAESFYDILSVTDDRNLLLASPAPSPEYRTQYGGQTPYIQLDIGLKTARTIDWNFANFNQLTPAERANFEANYQLSQYDDLRIATEDLTIIAPAVISIIPGVGAVSYRKAEVSGTVVDDRLATTEALVLRRQGAFILTISALAFQTASASNTPAFTMSVQEAADFINSYWSSFFGDLVAYRNPDGSLRLSMNYFVGGATPQLEVMAAHTGFGLAISNNLGSAMSAVGTIRTVSVP